MRKTQFWKTHTPDKVGPGTYNLDKLRTTKHNSVPFSNSENRALSATRPVSDSLPGPGAYSHYKNWGHTRTSSNYSLSKAPRMLPFAPGVTGYVLPSSFTSPGPGTYDLPIDGPKPPYSGKSRTRSSSLVIGPSAPSIPDNHPRPIVTPSVCGPPVWDFSVSTNFGAYKAKRAVFPPTHEGEPGPGEYSVGLSKEKRSSWMFHSTTERCRTAKSDPPGPGSYDSGVPSEYNAVTVEGFGSTTKRDIPLSNDPHRPFIVGLHATPPVGNYNTQEENAKTQNLKQKFIHFEVPVKRPPFNTGDRKEGPWTANANPGPGHYSARTNVTAKDSGKPFNSKCSRFKRREPELLPGPGSYELTNSPQFKLRAARFTTAPTENSSGPYLGCSQWPVRHPRVPSIGFASSAVRLSPA